MMKKILRFLYNVSYGLSRRIYRKLYPHDNLFRGLFTAVNNWVNQFSYDGWGGLYIVETRMSHATYDDVVKSVGYKSNHIGGFRIRNSSSVLINRWHRGINKIGVKRLGPGDIVDSIRIPVWGSSALVPIVLDDLPYGVFVCITKHRIGNDQVSIFKEVADDIDILNDLDSTDFEKNNARLIHGHKAPSKVMDFANKVEKRVL